jgi:hypothetical protein
LAAVLTAGCSSSSGDGAAVASLGHGSGSASHPAAGKASPLAYSRCMRQHGVTKFPDPDSNGQLRIAAGPGTGIDPESAVFKAAQQACKSLEPTPPAGQRKKMYGALLKFAQCMRKHGIQDFPDPQDGRLLVPRDRINVNSPQFKSALNACRDAGHVGGGSENGDG